MTIPSTGHSSLEALPEMAANAQALAASMSDVWKSVSGLSLPLPAVVQLQNAYLQQSSELWNQTLMAGKAGAGAAASAAPADRRFSGQDWTANPASANAKPSVSTRNGMSSLTI